jgi:hypothetical protein
MTVSSRFEVTTLNNCDPGDLIRDVDFNADGAFALVSDPDSPDANKRLIVSLSDTVQVDLVEFTEDVTVLRYLDPPIFAVDHNHGFVLKKTETERIKGAIICTAEGTVLNANYGLSEPGVLFQIDLETGLVRPRRYYGRELYYGRGVVFLSWSLLLPSAPDVDLNPVELLKFTAQG